MCSQQEVCSLAPRHSDTIHGLATNANFRALSFSALPLPSSSPSVLLRSDAHAKLHSPCVQMLNSLKAQKEIAMQSAKLAQQRSSKLQREREVDEDMYMIMCESVREKDLEVG